MLTLWYLKCTCILKFQDWYFHIVLSTGLCVEESEGEEKFCTRWIFCGQHIHFCSSIFIIAENVLSVGFMFLYEYETGDISYGNESLMSV